MVAKYAGRAGDGFICTSGKGVELYKDKLIPAVAEGAEAADRNPDDIDRMIEIKISYDTDPKLALENTRFWAPLSLTAEQKHSIDDPIEMEKAADALPIEQVAKRWIVASDPDEAVAKVGQYVDGASTTWSSTPPATTSAGSWSCSRRIWSRGCASWAKRRHPLLKEVGAAGGPAGGFETCRHAFRAVSHCHRFLHFGTQSRRRQFLGW